jgi:hypothetical protein
LDRVPDKLVVLCDLFGHLNWVVEYDLVA